jgi:hypothetical protein
LSASCFGTVTITQHVAGHQETAPGNTAVCAISSSGAGHNLIVGAVYEGPDIGGSLVTSVIDNQSHAYTLVGGASGVRTAVFHSLNASAGTTSVTINFNVPVTDVYYKGCVVYEVSGALAVDSASVLNDGRCISQVCSGAAISTSTSIGFIIAVIAADPVDQNPHSGSVFTAGGSSDLAGMGAACSLISASASVYTPDWHITNSGNPNIQDRFWTSTVSYKQ